VSQARVDEGPEGVVVDADRQLHCFGVGEPGDRMERDQWIGSFICFRQRDVIVHLKQVNALHRANFKVNPCEELGAVVTFAFFSLGCHLRGCEARRRRRNILLPGRRRQRRKEQGLAGRSERRGTIGCGTCWRVPCHGQALLVDPCECHGIFQSGRVFELDISA
jgi:hypothetical protein